jgi:hypothetical protein
MRPIRPMALCAHNASELVRVPQVALMCAAVVRDLGIPMAGRQYGTEELQLIATLRDQGLSIPAVARELGRTPSGIQGVLRARRWVDPARSKLMSSVSVFSPEQRDAFREFVCSRAADHSSTDIRDLWNKDAATKPWPTVNNERVLYYLRAQGLKKTKSEYMRFESYRKRQSSAQQVRRAKEQASRLRILRVRREELYAREGNLPRRKCDVCRETWPLADEFFRHSGTGRKYFLKTCRNCYRNVSGTAVERQKQRMEAYDRDVIVKQISLAKVERDAFLHQHRNSPTRRCSRCHETWELLLKRFPKYKLPSGRELFRRTCRFCLRTDARFKERAKLELERTQTVKPETNARRVVGQGNHAPFSVQQWSLLKGAEVIISRPDEC